MYFRIEALFSEVSNLPKYYYRVFLCIFFSIQLYKLYHFVVHKPPENYKLQTPANSAENKYRTKDVLFFWSFSLAVPSRQQDCISPLIVSYWHSLLDLNTSSLSISSTIVLPDYMRPWQLILQTVYHISSSKFVSH